MNHYVVPNTRPESCNGFTMHDRLAVLEVQGFRHDKQGCCSSNELEQVHLGSYRK